MTLLPPLAHPAWASRYAPPPRAIPTPAQRRIAREAGAVAALCAQQHNPYRAQGPCPSEWLAAEWEAGRREMEEIA